MAVAIYLKAGPPFEILLDQSFVPAWPPGFTGL